MAGFWKKALIYLGLVEEEDELEPLPEVHEPPQLETVRPIRPDAEPSAVRRIPPAGGVTQTAPSIGGQTTTAGAMVMPPPVVHVVEPRDFDDVKEVGDKLKIDAPVIMNLQSVDADLARRILAFASGLTYGLSGGMKKIADRVFLLTPANVEISAEETQRIISERGFFNQF
jgi:cell division inhibitor SepF